MTRIHILRVPETVTDCVRMARTNSWQEEGDVTLHTSVHMHANVHTSVHMHANDKIWTHIHMHTDNEILAGGRGRDLTYLGTRTG